MKKVIRHILLLLLLLGGCCPKAQATRLVDEGRPSRDMLYDGDARDRHVGEAVLTDAEGGYRVVSSRPQRVLPVSSAKQPTSRSGSRVLSAHLCCPTLKTICFDGRCRCETAPHPSPVSSAYYVIALRRILR